MAKRYVKAFTRRRKYQRTGAAAVALAALGLVACSSPEERLERFSASGQEFLEKGQYGKANVQFQNALKINDSHVPALLGLSKIAEDKQDFRAMFALMQRIVRLDPNNVDAMVSLGKLYLIGSDETSAMEHAESALMLEPDNIEARALKAAVLLKVGDSVGAVDLAQQVVAVEPAHSEAITVLAAERSLAGAPEAAVAILDEALAINEKTAILQLLRIQMLTSMDRQEDVMAAFENLISLFPDEIAYRRVYAGNLLRSNELARALEQIETIARLEPDNLDAKLDIVRIVRKLESADAALVKLTSFVDAESENADLKFALGDYYRQEGDNERALNLYTTLSESSDVDIAVRARNQIAALYLMNGDRDKAREIIDAILAEDPGNTDALVKRAGLLIDNGESDAAIRDLRIALGNTPDAPGPMVLMASALERTGEFGLADSQYVRAMEASGDAPNIADIFAKYLMRQNKPDRAEEVLLKSLSAHPGNLENLRFLGAIRLAQQNWRGAQEIADIIEQIGEEGENVAADIRTVAFSGLQDYDSVINALLERSERAPLQARPLATLISAYLKSGRIEEAEATLRRIIGAQRGAYAERIYLANVLGVQDRIEEAEQTLLEAIDAEPGRSEAYEILYRYYSREGENEKAWNLINQGLNRTPDNQALRIFKADIYLANNQLREAFDLYSDLVDERPNDKIVVNNYISLASEFLTDTEEIKGALKKGEILAGDDNAYFKDTLGWAHFRSGDPATALPLLEDAASAEPPNGEILYHLGAVYSALGEKEQARITLEKALEVGGEDFRHESEVRDLLEGA